ncbi:MAG: GH25 family lysozyme [Pseudorhodobacter sp.]|nr:GH25 family lysozyme [Pseudorhodobacter sp.]
MHRLIRLFTLATIAVGLIGCASPEALQDSAAANRVAVRAPQFGDTNPTDWRGDGPERHAVHGIDVARFQTDIDWRAAKAAGVSFAYVKATEGGDLLDSMFASHWRAAARAGVARGAYHFFYHCRPAAEQARFFIANVPRVAGALPPVLDMEWTPFSPTCTRRPPAAKMRAEAAIFIAALERHYGQRPLLYTTVDFYRENEMGRLGGTEVWLRSVAVHPAETFAGQHWTFWQYTGTGLVPGVKGETDINVFEGTQADWADWLALRRQ